MTNWRSRIVGHGEEPPEQLLGNPLNWRVHPQAQQDALADVLDRVGWVQDVIVNRRSGHVVDGHARIALAISRQEPSVPVVYVDLEDEEERLVLASLDPLSAMATTDEAILAELLEGVVAEGALGEMLGALGGRQAAAGLTDPDAVPGPSEEPYVRRGELYALGEHRLLCGDATSPDDVARLLGDEAPGLMVTDPPYGVGYDPGWRNEEAAKGRLAYAARRVGEIANDDRSDWREAWALAPSPVAYVWHAGRFASTVQASLESAGYEIRSQIIWSKSNFPISRGHYHWRHEPCWYAVRSDASAGWIGDRKQTTVWEVDLDPNVAGGHSTQKPVECMERALRNHRGYVYDPFVGTGTTLIAAERQGRRCFAMDVEPRWCQVAIERWEAFTGRTAERLDG